MSLAPVSDLELLPSRSSRIARTAQEPAQGRRDGRLPPAAAPLAERHVIGDVALDVDVRAVWGWAD